MSRLKGNMVVGQSGGPTAVLNAALGGLIREARLHGEIQDILGMKNGIQGLLEERFVDLRKEKVPVMEKVKHVPGAALGSCRFKLSDEDFPKIISILKAYDIRYFFYIGGNGSALTSLRVDETARKAGYLVRVMGVPKTIDNDMQVTDHTPGYGSVARFHAFSMQDCGMDSETIGNVDRVKIYESMGRNTGWVTASTAIGKRTKQDAPHLMYFPERAFIVEKFLTDIKKVFRERGYVVAAVCEGLRDEKGKPLFAYDTDTDKDAYDRAQLGGVGETLARLVTEELKLKARSDKPGTIQRNARMYVSSVDMRESYGAGQAAVRQAVSGKSGFMVILKRERSRRYKCSFGLTKLYNVALNVRKLPDDFINVEGNFVTEKYLSYVKPLVGHPLPENVRLQNAPCGKGGLL